MKFIRMFPAFFLALIACQPIASQAQGFEAINRLKVFAAGPTEFEVIEALGEGPRGIWCAAADYVKARYGQGTQGRLYVLAPRGPARTVQGRKGVVFTIDAARLPVQPSRSTSVVTDMAGVGLPVNHAIQFCKDYLIELEDVLWPRRRD